MKRILSCLYLYIVVLCVYAGPVDYKKAAALAKQMLSGVEVEMYSDAVEAKSRVMPVSSKPEFYIFNSASGEDGFVIVSGDEAFPEILAYSDKGKFTISEDMHPGLKSLLSFYSQYIDDFRCGKVSAPSTSGSSADTVVVVSPLCSSEWEQTYPFNLLCPQVGTITCPVGCVATAMSQIMRKYQWPEKGKEEKGICSLMSSSLFCCA